MSKYFSSVNTPDLKKERILEDAAKRFRMLCEYTFNITEDDGEEDMNTGDQQTDQMPQDNMNQPNMEQPMPDMGGSMPNNGMGGPNEQQPQPDMMGGNVSENGSQGAPGFNPQAEGDMMGDNMPEMGVGENMQDDDEVIDVDDLTQSQEETEEKVNDIQISMEKGFEKLLGVVSKLNKMIDSSTANMEQIKQEIEKRNPTPIEKLNMRAANDSYPFNVSPNDYWKEKESTSNYRIGGEDEKDAPQYTITQGDIDKITDFQTISKELDDSMMNQNLLNIFGLR
jgi:hypothetical protein